jgi:acyl-CoA-binding protein
MYIANTYSGLTGPMTPSTDTKLRFYGLFKQAKEGRNTNDQPWAVQFEAKAKWLVSKT